MDTGELTVFGNGKQKINGLGSGLEDGVLLEEFEVFSDFVHGEAVVLVVVPEAFHLALCGLCAGDLMEGILDFFEFLLVLTLRRIVYQTLVGV